jgi:hypothetical protein
MALPPLELFSLKKRLPRCRVASSLFWKVFRDDFFEMNGYQSGMELMEDGNCLRYCLTAERDVVDAESREPEGSSQGKGVYVPRSASGVSNSNRYGCTCNAGVANRYGRRGGLQEGRL